MASCSSGTTILNSCGSVYRRPSCNEAAADPVDALRSDGTQPHRISIEFAKRTAVTVSVLQSADTGKHAHLSCISPQHVSLWLNVRRDDSYTPTKILVEAGTDYHDLTEVRYRSVERASGRSNRKNPAETYPEDAPPPRTSMTKVTIQPRTVWALFTSRRTNHVPPIVTSTPT